MADTALRGIFIFLEKVGLFDILLPFILVFTILFAILEKTKVFGTDDIEGKKYPKKNLNAIASFAIAFLVVASTKLVGIINEVVANTTLLLLLSILFLLLVGSFFKEGDPVYLEGGWKVLFMVIMFIGIILIFLNSLGWLENTWQYFGGTSKGEAIGVVVMIIVVILFIMAIIKEPKKSTAK
ncbi:hypothetical protein ISS05_00710 [Candidatus Woesearchaeota archaeon]|nr:hypothetical protein [Candidatus Woesearchaeota archaeon]